MRNSIPMKKGNLQHKNPDLATYATESGYY